MGVEDFKPPEEHGVDFYLVDLRGAQYDVAQEEHFKKCGAILRAKKA